MMEHIIQIAVSVDDDRIEALSGDGYSEIAEAAAARLSRSQKFRDKVAEAYRIEER